MALFFKILTGTLITLVVIVLSGLSGLSFYLWPTSINDSKLLVTPDVIQRLHQLKSERKFVPDPGTFYPGVRDEQQRIRAQAAVDSTIQSLISELPRRPQRSTVLRAMKTTLVSFDTIESEERDQLLIYLTKIMDICGVESSSELLNVWRYGFPYGWFI